ncbi:RHS repeat-associated core domain-containing protein [Pseudomonas sp. Sample_10]|uniref:RHS repeat-associated core domain-containing protein n=1 Tax=Pseudomonas sp. Sample_10 TaxID=2448269 RepID=UPI001F4FCBD1|nr:RHS repeat-associated core domain-containing protein [Pseudomonas sp. Sample_10]
MQPKRETLLCRYHYDPLDRLVDCTPTVQATTRRFYLKDRLATEIQSAAQRSIMQHGDQLLAQRQRQSGAMDTRLLATDQQRSVLNVLDAARLNPLAYSPYGHRPAENGLLSLLGFNGERPDPVTGCYLLGNGYRAFNPVLMRFNSPDSWSPFGEGGLNAYAYCMGDPVNRTDQNGHAGLLKRMFMSLGRKLELKHSSHMTRANGGFKAATKELPANQHLSSVASLDYPDARQFPSRSSISSGTSKISSISSNYESTLSRRTSSFTHPREQLRPRAPLPMGVKSKTEWSYPKPDYSHQNIYEELQPSNAHQLASREIYDLDMQLYKEQKILDLLTSPQAREIKNISTTINNIRFGKKFP